MKRKQKRMDWVCNNCDEPLPSKDAVIAHYRREHPDDGYGLYDICGDVGDPLGTSGLKRMWAERAKYMQTEADARAKAKLYDELLAKWNGLCRALHIGREAMNAYRDAYEREEKK
jgi:hypothetical protein